MIDHTGVAVSDFARSKAWYEQALAPLGYAMLKQWETFAGFGVAPKPDFWIGLGKPTDKIHIAFRAASRSIVDAFYQAAIAAGGTDNGGPGVRAHYHEHYYGAFVLDPDGHNVEACCHEPYLG
jgi:catechol 2,3-dioxygenase-like lactoylglutathione lyase family enzyme